MALSTTTNDAVPEVPLPRLPSGKVDVAEWTKQLGVGPIDDLKELAVGVWPDEESVDDFLAARRQWRTEGQRGPSG
jgi:hypothetical protein